MIAAAIDIGSNSVKVVVGDSQRVLLDRVVTTRLGQGVDATGRLHPDAIARTLTALGELAQAARAQGAERVHAVATSAVRDAADGPDFIAQAAQMIGGTAEVLTGDQEAEATYLAARWDPELPVPADARLITTDVGGGSSEVVLGQGSTLLRKRSLQLGAGRLTEWVAPSDPWTTVDLAEANRRVAEAIAPLLTDGWRTPEHSYCLIASGGTASYLVSMEQAEAGTHPTLDSIHGATLSLAQLERRIALLAALPLTERRTVPGLDPARAEVIVAGAIIQAALVAAFVLPELRVSAHGLRYGVLYRLLGA